MSEEPSNSELSLREFYTSYHYCPTTEDSQFHEKIEHSNSQKSLTIDNNSLQKELNQFLSLLQKNPNENLNKPTYLPVIFSATEESSCLSEKGEVVLRKIEGELAKIDQKLKKNREKRANYQINKENMCENELLKEKVELLQKKIEFLSGNPRGNTQKIEKINGKISKFELLERKFAEFNRNFEQFITEIRKQEAGNQKKQRILTKMNEENSKYCENLRKNLLILRETSNHNVINSNKTRSLSRNQKKSSQESQESIGKYKRKTSVSCEIPTKNTNNKKIIGKKVEKEIKKGSSSMKKPNVAKNSKIEETFRRFLLKSIKK